MADMTQAAVLYQVPNYLIMFFISFSGFYDHIITYLGRIYFIN